MVPEQGCRWWQTVSQALLRTCPFLSQQWQTIIEPLGARPHFPAAGGAPRLHLLHPSSMSLEVAPRRGTGRTSGHRPSRPPASRIVRRDAGYSWGCLHASTSRFSLGLNAAVAMHTDLLEGMQHGLAAEEAAGAAATAAAGEVICSNIGFSAGREAVFQWIHGVDTQAPLGGGLPPTTLAEELGRAGADSNSAGDEGPLTLCSARPK